MAAVPLIHGGLWEEDRAPGRRDPEPDTATRMALETEAAGMTRFPSG